MRTAIALAIVATLALAPRVAHAEVSPHDALSLLGYLSEAAHECHYRATVQPILDVVNDMHVPSKPALVSMSTVFDVETWKIEHGI